MNIVILGESLFSTELVKNLQGQNHKIYLVVKDKEEAVALSGANGGVIVVNNDPAKPEVLDDLDLENCNAFIAATKKEEVNILACLYAKDKGVKKLYAKTINPDTADILKAIGVEALTPEISTAHDVSLHLNKPLVAQLVEQGGEYDITQTPVSQYKNLVERELGLLQGDFFVVLAFHVDGHFFFGANKKISSDSTLIIMYKKDELTELDKALKSL